MKEAGPDKRRSAAGEPPGDDSPERRARELGIDLALLRENLKLTPLERMRRHDRAVRQILAVRKRLGVDDRLAESHPDPESRSKP